MKTCPNCGFNLNGEGSLDMFPASHPEWYTLLGTMDGRTPSVEHCREWLQSSGISEDDAQDTALALKSRLGFDTRKGVWWTEVGGRRTSYASIWATFQVWARRNRKSEPDPLSVYRDEHARQQT